MKVYQETESETGTKILRSAKGKLKSAVSKVTKNKNVLRRAKGVLALHNTESNIKIYDENEEDVRKIGRYKKQISDVKIRLKRNKLALANAIIHRKEVREII